MEKYTMIFAVITYVVLLTVACIDAAECCSAYTDLHGDRQNAMLCTDYCCFDISFSISDSLNAKKTCCGVILRRVPQDKKQADCVKDWLKQYIWAPIASGIFGLILLVSLVTLCCCCGCCGACGRSQSRPGVIVMRSRQPQETFMMSSQMNNPAYEV